MHNFTPSERKEIYDRVIAQFGEAHQIMKCVEEMSELTKEICKSSGGEKNRLHMAEEIADVQITVEQLIQIFDLDQLVKDYRDIKLELLTKRIE